MKATDLLMQEHRVIERALIGLELAADALQHGGDVRPGFFVEAAEFLSGFADGCHHRKEEDVLFRAMLATGAQTEDGAIAMMSHEHEEGRAYTHALRNAAKRMAKDPSARRDVITNVRRYVALLRAHIEKEDDMLFPIADELIPPEQHDQLFAECVRADQPDMDSGAHARFLALAERLEHEALAFRL